MEAGSSTGSAVDVGAGARIGPRVHVPGATIVPKRAKWKTAADVPTAAASRESTRSISASRSTRSAPRPARGLEGAAIPDVVATDLRVGERVTAQGASAEFRANWNAFE